MVHNFNQKNYVLECDFSKLLLTQDPSRSLIIFLSVQTRIRWLSCCLDQFKRKLSSHSFVTYDNLNGTELFMRHLVSIVTNEVSIQVFVHWRRSDDAIGINICSARDVWQTDIRMDGQTPWIRRNIKGPLSNNKLCSSNACRHRWHSYWVMGVYASSLVAETGMIPGVARNFGLQSLLPVNFLECSFWPCYQ